MIDEYQKKLIEAEIELFRLGNASTSFNNILTTFIKHYKRMDLSEFERGRLEGLQMTLEAFNKVFNPENKA